MNARLFVYGTLRKDCRNGMHHMISGEATFVGHARMRGRLYQVGGDHGGYPGLVCATGEPAWVQGEVYLLAHPADVLARLDEYEGCGPRDARPHEYARVQREVVLETGAREQAWVYVYSGPLEGRPEIRSGDYCRPSAPPAPDARQ